MMYAYHKMILDQIRDKLRNPPHFVNSKCEIRDWATDIKELVDKLYEDMSAS